MTVLLDPSIVSDLEACRTRLAKKATFEKAVADVKVIVQSHHAQFALPSAQAKLLDVTGRCMTLLKTRYTSPAFWRIGSELLAQCQVLSRLVHFLLVSLNTLSLLDSC